MATRIGLEPTTPSVTGWCSNQLSYRAMIAQVRAASYRGNVLYYIEKSACCQAQICRKCNFLQKGVKTPSVCSLWSQPHSPFCRSATSSPGRGKSALKGTAFGGGGKVSGRAKGPILEGAVERSETEGVLLKTKRTSSEEPVRHGRGSKFRTHGTRFWRPLLYQLSYTPIYIR